jgi:hypothetical protein
MNRRYSDLPNRHHPQSFWGEAQRVTVAEVVRGLWKQLLGAFRRRG